MCRLACLSLKLWTGPLRLVTLLALIQTGLAGCGGELDDAAGDAGSDSVLDPRYRFGPIYYDLGGSRGVVLCFHGSGGRGPAWASGDKGSFIAALRGAGYGFVCPSSLDRVEARWENDDVPQVDAILEDLGVSAGTPLFLVGHSNGGGFVSRYAAASQRGDDIRAAQHSNASGITQIIERPSYRVPTIFFYADCDNVLDGSDKVRNNIALMGAKDPPVLHRAIRLDARYEGEVPATCHQFLDVSSESIQFFSEAI